MTYTSIDSSVIEAGDPITEDIMSDVKDNFDDLNSRTSDLEDGAAKVYVLNEVIYDLAQLEGSSYLDGFLYYEAKFDFGLTDAVVTAIDAATSGTLAIDIKKASSFSGTYSTVFSTLPSVTGSSAARSTNAVFSTTSVNAGDWLRLDIDSIQVGQGRIHVLIMGELS